MYKTFKSIEEYRVHSTTEHDIPIDLSILEDPIEEDNFTKMLKSMLVDRDYLQERVKYYPVHWDNIDLRIKIRMIAKMKYEGISRQIDAFMKASLNNSGMERTQMGISNEV